MKNQFKYRLRRVIGYILFTTMWDMMFISYLVK